MSSREIDKLKERIKKLEQRDVMFKAVVSTFFRNIIVHVENEMDFAQQLRKILDKLDKLY